MRLLAAGALAGSLVLAAACGGDDDDSASTPSTVGVSGTVDRATLPTPVAATSAPAAPASAPPEVPSRIVSLSPTHTEVLFAIGAADQVVAVDSLSTYPAETADVVTDLSAFEPNVEAVAGYEPNLVITDGTNPDFLTQLDSLGIAHWEGPAAVSLDDVYAQIEQLGAATGHVGDAAELVAQMQAEVEAITEQLPELDEPLSIYHELDDTYFSLTSDTIFGAVYNHVGLRNIADEAESAAGGYPQLNAEFIISADPDIIFLADARCCGQTADVVAARPGWDAITAVANGDIVELDEDVASRWGPRIVEFMQTVADAVDRVAAST